MAKSESIRARIEPKLKAEAERILDQLGLDASDAIRVFYKQVVLRKGLPFDVTIPNEATRRAMRDVQKGRGLTRYKDTAEMRAKLGLCTMATADGPPPRDLISAKAFEPDLKRLRKRGVDLEPLWAVAEALRRRHPLAARHRDHALTGDWKGFRDCHIQADWLLSYSFGRRSGLSHAGGYSF